MTGPASPPIGRITASREIDGKATTTIRHYLLSKPLTAQRFNDIVRAYWQIENQLHWVLNVVMDEGQCHARLRRFALNLLRQGHDQGSTRGKIMRASWDDSFLLGRPPTPTRSPSSG